MCIVADTDTIIMQTYYNANFETVTWRIVVVVVVYSQFLYRYKQTQSAKTRFRQAGARQRVVDGYHNK